MAFERAVRRPVCGRCLRAQAGCICRWIAPQTSRLELLILQHPLEVHNVKNSARLLHLSAPSSRLEVGEVFDPAQLQDWLAGDGRSPLLLYPDTANTPAAGPAPAADPAQLRLVLLDATWRKSRKMLHLNPLLQQLPRLALRGTPPSRYRMRKAHAPEQLSTLEAAVCAVMQCEPAARWDGLLDAFDGFVAQQCVFIPGRGAP